MVGCRTQGMGGGEGGEGMTYTGGVCEENMIIKLLCLLFSPSSLSFADVKPSQYSDQTDDKTL